MKKGFGFLGASMSNLKNCMWKSPSADDRAPGRVELCYRFHTPTLANIYINMTPKLWCHIVGRDTVVDIVIRKALRSFAGPW